MFYANTKVFRKQKKFISTTFHGVQHHKTKSFLNISLKVAPDFNGNDCGCVKAFGKKRNASNTAKEKTHCEGNQDKENLSIYKFWLSFSLGNTYMLSFSLFSSLFTCRITRLIKLCSRFRCVTYDFWKFLKKSIKDNKYKALFIFYVFKWFICNIFLNFFYLRDRIIIVLVSLDL